MKKLITLMLLFLLSAPCYAFMSSYTVNSGTWSPSDPADGLHHFANSRKYSLTLEATGDSSGNASITLSDLGVLDIVGHSITVVPDSSDTPLTGWDLSITDSSGADLVRDDSGTDMSISSTTDIYVELTHAVSTLTIAFTGIGEGKKATITIVFDVYYP